MRYEGSSTIVGLTPEVRIPLDRLLNHLRAQRQQLPPPPSSGPCWVRR